MMRSALVLSPLVLVAACASTPRRDRPAPVSSAAPAVELGDGVSVRPLAAGVWLHVTTDDGIPANGLLVDSAGGAILVDSGWNDAQAERLLAFAAGRGHPVSDVIVTHSHRDRLGGAAVALRRGLAVHALARTIEHAREHGRPVPTTALTSPATLERGGVRLELFFPGAGHSDDNAVVWLPGPRVLYGGCFLKSTEASDLGNIADADLAAWPASLAAVRARYPAPALIVPGHGPFSGGGDPIARTAALVAAHGGAAAAPSAR
jgi:glyoxylase-like metal-dependent hydrolase (beta-lactamase superfamily II)